MKTATSLARRLGTFDATLIVLGSVVGSGIFRTPAVVADRAGSAWLALAAWAAGGIVALFGAFVLAELAARRPAGFGAYAYLREAFHPAVAFAFGWTSLLVSFTGGLAAAALVFADYLEPATGLHLHPVVAAAAALALLALVSCWGVRESGNVQNVLTVLKVAAIAGLVVAGCFAPAVHPAGGTSPSLASASDFGIALIPVLFAYNGAVVANFMAPETQRAERALPTGLWAGMTASVVLFVTVNAICIRALGIGALAKSTTPLSDAVRVAAGPAGARLVAIAIALTVLGFMSNRMLTVPRLYHAMAVDGSFFRSAGWIDPKTRVPVVAIVIQGVVAIVLAATGSYARILDYVVFTTYTFAAFFAIALFVIRKRDSRAGAEAAGSFRMPLHPYSTIGVILVSAFVVGDTFARFPRDGIVASILLLCGIPAYAIWIRMKVAR